MKRNDGQLVIVVWLGKGTLFVNGIDGEEDKEIVFGLHVSCLFIKSFGVLFGR